MKTQKTYFSALCYLAFAVISPTLQEQINAVFIDQLALAVGWNS